MLFLFFSFKPHFFFIEREEKRPIALQPGAFLFPSSEFSAKKGWVSVNFIFLYCFFFGCFSLIGREMNILLFVTKF